jgi:mannose-6-phosphate isomerase-like protein (cupin superfamily)
MGLHVGGSNSARSPHAVALPLAGRTLASDGGSFVIAEWTDPGAPEDGTIVPLAPLHLHHEDDEAWYVLEGTLHFTIGGQEIRAPAGSAVFGPRGVPHTFWNPDPAPARYLLIMTPRTLALIAAIHRLPDRSPERLHALFREHGCALLETRGAQAEGSNPR